MSVNLRAIQVPVAASHTHPERTRARSDGARQDFSALLQEQEVATTATNARRPGAPGIPEVPAAPDGGRSLPGASDPTAGGNLAADGNQVTSTGTLSEDPRTLGMYVPPDFYHGTSYSPVFDQQDADGNWVATPRFAGQQIYGQWRGSLPEDFDPNARVAHDPMMKEQGPLWWKQNEDGTWVKRATGYGGIPLNDDGTPVYTPDPTRFPEYFASGPGGEET